MTAEAKKIKAIDGKKFSPIFIQTIEDMLTSDIPDRDAKNENFKAEVASKFFIDSYEDGWQNSAILLEKGIPLLSMGLVKTIKKADYTMREIPLVELRNTAEKILAVYAMMREIKSALVMPAKSATAEKLTLPED